MFAVQGASWRHFARIVNLDASGHAHLRPLPGDNILGSDFSAYILTSRAALSAAGSRTARAAPKVEKDGQENRQTQAAASSAAQEGLQDLRHLTCSWSRRKHT